MVHELPRVYLVEPFAPARFRRYVGFSHSVSWSDQTLHPLDSRPPSKLTKDLVRLGVRVDLPLGVCGGVDPGAVVDVK